MCTFVLFLKWNSQTDVFLPSAETSQTLGLSKFTDGMKRMIQLLLKIPMSLAKIFNCVYDQGNFSKSHVGNMENIFLCPMCKR